MAIIFSEFSNILPDPSYYWGVAGEDPNSITSGTYPTPPTTYGPGFSSVSLNSSETIMKARYNSNILERKADIYHKWLININYNSLPAEEFYPLYTFLLLKQETLTPFYVQLPQFANQSQSIQLLSTSYPKGASAITTGIIHDKTPGTILTFGNYSKVYTITRVETETESLTSDPVNPGEERLHITPSLQTAIDSGSDSLKFIDVMFKVNIVGNALSYTLNSKNLFSFSLKLEEVVTDA